MKIVGHGLHKKLGETRDILYNQYVGLAELSLRQSCCFHGLERRVTPDILKNAEEKLTLSIADPILAGLSVTVTPAFSRAATLVSAPPAEYVKIKPISPLDCTNLFRQK